MIKKVAFTVVLFYYFSLVFSAVDDFKEFFLSSFEKYEAEVKSKLRLIHDRWQISSYPNFLRSFWFSDSSYHILKNKFMSRLLQADLARLHNTLGVTVDAEQILHLHRNPTNPNLLLKPIFVLSFTGTSVTAGHDHYYNDTYVPKINHFLQPLFESMNINLIVRNGAIGNNDCIPYDVCVQTFAGAVLKRNVAHHKILFYERFRC
jgi:hypothetical protein